MEEAALEHETGGLELPSSSDLSDPIAATAA